MSTASDNKGCDFFTDDRESNKPSKDDDILKKEQESRREQLEVDTKAIAKLKEKQTALIETLHKLNGELQDVTELMTDMSKKSNDRQHQRSLASVFKACSNLGVATKTFDSKQMTGYCPEWVQLKEENEYMSQSMIEYKSFRVCYLSSKGIIVSWELSNIKNHTIEELRINGQDPDRFYEMNAEKLQLLLFGDSLLTTKPTLRPLPDFIRLVENWARFGRFSTKLTGFDAESVESCASNNELLRYWLERSSLRFGLYCIYEYFQGDLRTYMDKEGLVHWEGYTNDPIDD